MGVCISHEYSKPTAQETEIQQQFSNFSKVDERPPMAVEHQMYDYRQAYEEQDDELFAIICCPHSIGFDRDKIALIDLDPTSDTYCTIISEIRLTSNGDEPGRMNWAKSAESLIEMDKLIRKNIIVPCMNSGKIYVIGFDKNKFYMEKSKNIFKLQEIRSDELFRKDVSCPYAVRSLPLKGAPVHVSTMGDRYGHGKGDFVLIDRKTWEIRKKSDPTFSSFGGDFSLQPRHNLLISSEWGHPRLFRDGFQPSELENVSESFGSCLHVWQISPPKLLQSIGLDSFDGSLVISVKFLHNTDCNHAFAISAIGSSIFHLHMNTLSREWQADRVAHVPSLKVENWVSDEMPALLTDMIISMDDRWLYVCGFLHGIVWRFDIQDPFRVSLHGKINLGGVFDSSPEVRIKTSNAMEDRWWLPPETRSLPRGTKFRGGPALMQLSKDGSRLYVCNSFYKAWDGQFYPELISDGGQMVRVDIVDNEMRLNKKFLVDMKDQPNGPFVIRDIKFLDGDCTSDSFL
ncbi:Protein CBG06685 [Caenorhabditis briggsae]|uniref:Putative selenium-binding protein n=1 Tax=Caenorhabditis briggsae TaxID=6238 RepID=SBP_CAEBR|nr:Protein CBG06685 [Caenorhabditis briggsae]A8X2U9.2 RecName: Full=Putative selenium-binding protein [Caenorhabditis briggsae]CAP26959.2 Protein CBG06685 [Caenorhabditis briggsae]